MKHCVAMMILSAGSAFAQITTDLSGTWGFTHFNDQFQGWITIQQSGPTFHGTWHTSRGKSEPDDQVTGRIDGNIVTLWRFIGNNRQSFDLTLSPDSNRLDGFGNGFFLNHTNLNMQRSAASTATAASATVRKGPPGTSATPIDLAGIWIFTHFDDRFQGTITLRQDGSDVSGIWHTSKGKSEPDDTVSGHIDGNVVTLWRFIGDAQQRFLLTLSSDRSRLDGYGDGYFLNHTNLNMLRTQAAASPAVTSQPSN